MTTAIKRRRGTTAQHATFTGLEGEITVDTTKDTLVVHDGATAGGYPLLREDLSNNTNVASTSTAQTFTNKTFGDNPTFSAGTANGVAYLNGSKVLTTGSALTFDGTNFSTTGAVTATSYSRVTNGTIDMRMELAPGLGYVGTVSNHPVAFEVNSSEQMRLTSTGLGIGTSSPTFKLDVSGQGRFLSNTQDQLTIGTTSTGAGASLTITSGNGTTSSKYSYLNFINSQSSTKTWRIGTYGEDNFVIVDGSAERIKLDSSGNLGLGVTPSAWTEPAFQMKAGGMFATAGANLHLLENSYYQGGWKYYSNGNATRYTMVTGIHQWFTAPSGTAGSAISFTQAMTLDASGNLMVGTTTPLATTTGRGTIVVNGTEGSILSFGNSGTLGGYIYSSGSGLFFDAQSTRPLVFSNNSTERMRIDSSGNLLVGKTVANNTDLGVVIYKNGSASGRIEIVNGTAGGTTIQAFYYSNGTSIGSISATNTSTAFNTSSDYRLKENIQPMANALGIVSKLKPVTYTWKADGSQGQGFIAHELQAVVPDCVTGEKDAVDKDGKPVYQGIDTSFLVATLTKAIQEQQELINQLTARMAQLEGN